LVHYSYQLLNPVIVLTITDFVLFEELPDVISRFKLMHKREMIEYMDDIELVFTKLPKFTKVENELTGILDKWIYFIKLKFHCFNFHAILVHMLYVLKNNNIFRPWISLSENGL